MRILKYLLATIIYVLLVEILGLLVFMNDSIIEYNINFYVIINSILKFVVVIIFVYKSGAFKDISFTQTRFIFFVFAFVIGSCYSYIQTPLNLLYNALFDTEISIIYDFDKISRLWSLSSISIILLDPFIEELFFKQYIQKRLEEKYKPIIAIGFSALFFSLIHIGYGAFFVDSATFDFHYAYIAFVGGLISGILYYKSKSIGPSILFHIMWNLVASII